MAVQCPICKNKECSEFCSSRDYNWDTAGIFLYMKCLDCGFVFLEPPPDVENIAVAYPEFYGSSSDDSLNNIEKRINVSANKVRLNLLNKFKNGKTLLDVGCGSGFFLEYMRRSGWEVSGVDQAQEHIDFARNSLKLKNVRKSEWPILGNTEIKMDAISFLHVLEHLPFNVVALSVAEKMLKTDGIILVETPNIESWSARIFKSRWVTLDAPRHLGIFSPKSLRICLEKAGFEVAYLNTYSPSTMEYSESIRYMLTDKGLRSKRLRAKNILKDCKEVEIPAFSRMVNIKVKNILHGLEKVFYCSANRLADKVGCGCNLLAVGRKSSSV